jgi:hypothetical protein
MFKMKHSFILLDSKLKSLAEERRWKEYNSLCRILCKNKPIEKVNIVKMRSWINQDLLEKINNVCAVCLNKYDYCIVSSFI